MNQLLVAFALLVSAHGVFSDTTGVTADKSHVLAQGGIPELKGLPNVVSHGTSDADAYASDVRDIGDVEDDHRLLGRWGVNFFDSIQKNSQLYALLMSLDVEAPEIGRKLEYLALLNEAHQTNRRLVLILRAIQETNQILRNQQLNL